MNIGIVDVDGHNFPNFALMKISAWHKSQSDNVEIALPLFGNYDRVYQSKIFTFTPDSTDFDGTCEVIAVLAMTFTADCPKRLSNPRQWTIQSIPSILSRSNSFLVVAYGIVRSASSMTKRA